MVAQAASGALDISYCPSRPTHLVNNIKYLCEYVSTFPGVDGRLVERTSFL